MELFRNCWGLAPELLEVCADIAYRHDHLERTSIDLSQVVSTEYRADSVIELRDHGNAVVAAIVVEIQLGLDADKKYSWPVYVTALRAKLRCPAVLLVLTPEDSVAQWARRTIDIGHPDFHLRPVVISFDDVPRIDDTQAQRLPELAVLSAMAHRDLEAAETAVTAIAPLPEELKRLYLDVILANLPEALRRTLEARLIKGYQYQSEFARRYYNEGREKGHQEGHQEGLRAAALAIARGRLAPFTADDLAAIEGLRDERLLTKLIGALAEAGTPSEVRTAFERLLRDPASSRPALDTTAGG